MVTTFDPQAAPGALEQVRVVLNTWAIPNDTRAPVDRFDDYRRRRRLAFADAEVVRELRDDLRGVVEGNADGDDTLTAWIARLDVKITVEDGSIAFRHGGNSAGDLLVAVLHAVSSGAWSRLKACPDCRWVFYDNTRSGTKRWCQMSADGSTARGCGNIAKARRHRARRRPGT